MAANNQILQRAPASPIGDVRHVEANALDLRENLRRHLPRPVQKKNVARTEFSNVGERQFLLLPNIMPIPGKLAKNFAEHTAMPGFASRHEISLRKLCHFAVRR
jgi:hypothetical protein